MSKAIEKSPKKIVKKSVKAKSPKKIANPNENKPIRIIVEIVLRDEIGTPKGINANMLSAAVLPTIGYEFSTNLITVLNLGIENKSVPKPGRNGTVQLDYFPLSGMITVNAMATGQGAGSLQLTYNGKNLFTKAVDFNFTNGIGFINELAKLP